MYIAIEGIDTVGKSTQIAKLKEVFKEAIFTKEPGGTKFGEDIRKMVLQGDIKNPITELLLFLADRSEHYHQVVEKNRDSLIVSDRSFLSGIAYAYIHGDFSLNYLIELNRFALNNHFPQKIILFEIEEQELKKRLSKKEHDSIESRGTDYLLSIQKNMHTVAETLNLDALCINASDSIEDIHNQITTYIKGA